MMKYLFGIWLMIVTFFLAGCPEKINEPDSVVAISNKSSISIGIYYIGLERDDTLLSNIPYPLNSSNVDTLAPDVTVSIREPFIQSLQKGQGKILMFYIFSIDTLNMVPWERIRDEYLILKRYEVTLDDLRDGSHAIIYE